jgi:ribosomal-protein-alanine N-acetyltransferase
MHSRRSKIVAMVVEDLDEVLAIEGQSHPKPWTENIFREELEREWARLVVVKEIDTTGASRVVGFCNYWLVHDEVHLLNIATDEHSRRRGFGRQLLGHIIDFARDNQCRYVTLEVRKSNLAAQGLYQTEGFQSVGLRPRYYADNKEDAVIMLLEL